MHEFPLVPPIIVDESGDVDVFESVQYAESYLEAIDVEKRRFVAYDKEGRLLELLPTSTRITIRSAEEQPNHADDLKNLLLKFLSRVGVSSDWLAEASLEELVNKSLEFKIDPTGSPFDLLRDFFLYLKGRFS